MMFVTDGVAASKYSSVLLGSASDGFQRTNSYAIRVSLALFYEDISRFYLGFNAVDSRQCPAIGSKVIGSVLSPIIAVKSVNK